MIAVLVLVFAGASWIQLAYWWLAKDPPDIRHERESDSERLGLSIIICARNEAENLRAHLPYWLNQTVFLNLPGCGQQAGDGGFWQSTDPSPDTADIEGSIYPSESPGFAAELIVVDDFSRDETAEVVRSFLAPHVPLRLLQPDLPTRPGKKDALTYAISQASYDYLLLSDADCRPASARWAEQMAAPLHAGFEVVVGHGAYSQADSRVARWQHFAAEYHGLQYRCCTRYAGFALGTGRNLAYHRSFFRQQGGLERHAHLSGGDDDLLLVQACPRAAVVAQPTAWTWSIPAADWADYKKRKQRHFSVGRYYPPKASLVLLIHALSHGLFYLLGFILLFTAYWHWALVVYVIRLVLLWRAYPRPLPQWLIYDAGLCFYMLWQAWLSVSRSGRNSWEDRAGFYS